MAKTEIKSPGAELPGADEIAPESIDPGVMAPEPAAGPEVDTLKLVKRMLRVNEGCRLFVYNDSRGIPTIGFGRNLRDKGISQVEAEILFENDILDALAQVGNMFTFFDKLDAIRQAVLVDMAFNLGPLGLGKFKNTAAAIAAGDFKKAAAEMLASRWAGQVGIRAERLALMMETGQVPEAYDPAPAANGRA